MFFLQSLAVLCFLFVLNRALSPRHYGESGTRKAARRMGRLLARWEFWAWATFGLAIAFYHNPENGFLALITVVSAYSFLLTGLFAVLRWWEGSKGVRP